jgi:hypothetical protein
MGDFATSFETGWNIGSDIVAAKLVKQEKERAKKLLEDFQAKVEEYQISGNEITYSEKLQLGVLVSQLGQTYATTFDSINTAQSNYDKEKMTQEAQNLRNKNDNLTILIKEMKDNPYLSGADLSAFDKITGLNLSQLWNKETIDKIKNNELSKEEFNEKLGITGKLPEEYRKPYMEQQGIIQPGLEATTTAPKAAGISDYNSAVNYLKNYANSKMSDENFYKVRDGTAAKFGLDLSNMTRESLKEPEKVIGKSTKGISAQDFLFGDKLGTNIFAGMDLNTLTDEDKTSIRNYYNLNKSFIIPEELPQVEAYLTQLGVDLNAPIINPETTIETTPQPGLIQKGVNWVKNAWNQQKGYPVTSMQGTPTMQGTKKDYTTMTVDELYELADKQNDAGAYAELKRRGYIK